MKRKATSALPHVRIPAMPELQKTFMFDGHGALTTLRMEPTIDAFNQVADLFNVVSVSIAQAGKTSPVLESGARTLVAIGTRHQQGGRLYVGKWELPALQNAMLECERLVREFDVFSMYVAGLKAVALKSLGINGETQLEPA